MKTTMPCTAVLSTALLAGCVSSTAVPAPETYRVYFGTQAKQDAAGIYMALLDMKTGQLGKTVRVSNAAGTGFLAIHPDGQHLYSTGANGVSGGTNTGSVLAFRIVEPEGTLTNINMRISGGLLACHVSIDPTGRNLLVANYLGGSCAVLPIQRDGALAPISSLQQHTGSGPNPKRQTAAFTHSINCDPSGHFAIVADLGIDKIMTYRFDAADGTLTPNDPPFIATEPGGGPRHFTFHPSGKFAYADLELSNKVVVFQYDDKWGGLTEIQTISTLPDGFSRESTASEILTTPDGRFLYVANRGHNSLAIFAIDSATGKLTPLGHEPVRGENPRNFNIDPTGTFLIAVNAKPGNAVVFRINRETGLLEFTGSEIEVPNPGCVRFLAAP
jgi:6-phosphogluconolactonase